MIRLKQGQGLNIGSESYIVTGCISYRSGSNTWDEYTLINASGREAWLSVDNNDGELVLSHIGSSRRPTDYKLVDQGTATVTGRFGNTDVDFGERVRYFEYEDSRGIYTYSVEEWEDETEYSEGRYIKEYEIQLLETPPFEYKASSADSSLIGKIIAGVIAALFFILSPLASCLGASCSNSCKSCSPSDPNYTQCQYEYRECVRARSVRQTSSRTRRSSGGGMHHGK